MRTRRFVVALVPCLTLAAALAGVGAAVGAERVTGQVTGGVARGDAVAMPARANGPGSWTKVSTGKVSTTAGIAVLRTADGVLHVVYPRDRSTSDDLAHTAIGTEGQLVSQSDIVTNWDTVNPYPALVPTASGGLRAIFGGNLAAPAGNPFSHGYVLDSSSDATGSAWITTGTRAVGQGDGYAGTGTAAAVLTNFTPVTAFGVGDATLESATMHYQTGLNTTPSSFMVAKSRMDHATMASDGTTAFVAWQGDQGSYSTVGVFVRQLRPTLGSLQKAPKSSDALAMGGNYQATAFGHRADGYWLAYCVGYPSCEYVGLWQLGTSTVYVVPGSAGARYLTMHVAASGRIWIAWSTEAKEIKVVRTSATGLAFGGVRTLPKPPDADKVLTLAIEGSRARADLVVNGGNGLYAQQVLPGLVLKASPKTWAAGSRKKVTFTVLDAGDLVSGATISADRKSCTTAVTGTCTIRFAASGKRAFDAKATAESYARTTIRLKVT